MEKTNSLRKKTKTVYFDIPKPAVRSMEEPEVIYDCPNMSPRTFEEEEPSTPPSPSKIPSISPTSSPPKSHSISLTQTPPSSLTKEPKPLTEKTPKNARLKP